jgi:hypothetical protein
MSSILPELHSKCPTCAGESQTVVYGYPTFEAHVAQYSGKYKLGGCQIEFPIKNRYCPTCELYFRSPIGELLTLERFRSLLEQEDKDE